MTTDRSTLQGAPLNSIDVQMRAYVRAFANVLFPATVLAFAVGMTAFVLA